MFHQLPSPLVNRMKVLEAIDLRDRNDGTPHNRRLRQVEPDTGKFLALQLAIAPAGEVIEIGASAGYSTLWLALACRATGRSITTFEVLPNKIQLAEETFASAGVGDVVHLVAGNALELLAEYENIAFCFLDAEKDIYGLCYELVVPRLVSGGILLADNTISHGNDMRDMLDKAAVDDRVDAVNLTIDKGILMCRKV